MDFKNILIQFWQPALFAFTLAVLLIHLAVRFFPKLGLMDRPAKYGLTRKPIPYYGGVAIFLTFIVSIFVFVPLNKALFGLVAGSTVIATLGFFDDFFALSPWIRLFVQFLAVLILVFSGIGIFSINLPFFGVLALDQPIWGGIAVLSALFTVFWVMAILNTMNFIDGVSGLNSGVTFVAALTMFFLSINPTLNANPHSQLPVAIISLLIAMIALAFLLFDFPQARILMGDTGSTFFGFVLATLAIFSGGKVATAFLVLGMPILDMIWVIFRRIFSGKKFWQGDRKHLHHRLLNIGFSEKGVVLMYLAVTAVFGFTAVVLVSGQQKFFMMIALGFLMVLLATALIILPNKKNTYEKK